MYVDYSNKQTHLHIPAHVALGGAHNSHQDWQTVGPRLKNPARAE